MSLGDFDSQKRQFSFPAAIVTAANHDAQKALHDALVAAIMDVTLGTLDFEEFVADREQVRPFVRAAAMSAQVNIECVVTYEDDVTLTQYNVRIPTVDLEDDTLWTIGTNQWDPTDAKWVEFISAFEALVLSDLGNAVSVVKVVYLQ
jgi:hypothetical protein